jgi:LmbE family N-acetylglucosaminyl deacetylase
MKFKNVLIAAVLLAGRLFCAGPVAVVDNTSYNAGAEVMLRATGVGAGAVAAVRYAGDASPVVRNIPIAASGVYGRLWSVPPDARTGRYEVEITDGGHTTHNAASFAVHRQLAKTTSITTGRTFYTSGDALDIEVTVKNLSSRRLTNLRVEFGPYQYPWIAQAPDEPKRWATVIADPLTLEAGQEKHFNVAKAAVTDAGSEPAVATYAVIIRDSKQADRIYDLAFTNPVFLHPANQFEPKRYPFLYLYPRERDVPKSEAYRQFYPPEFVSDKIHFDTNHTMFGLGTPVTVGYGIEHDDGVTGISARILDMSGKQIDRERSTGAPIAGEHRATLKTLDAGRYVYDVSLLGAGDVVIGSNRLEFTVNPLPKSILVFAAHEDDDTAHPALIRAAVENHVPIYFVYFTSGDAGGCEHMYERSCDAARAMDFGETRMQETRASLAHMGVPSDHVFFLGLPDGGMEQIWYYHVKASNPYLSVLLASDHSPYREAAVPNLPYARESVIAAAKDFLRRFEPELVVTGHPDERHVDHRTSNWYVVQAMQALLREGSLPASTELIVDQSYGPGPQKHAPYQYEKQTLFVSGEAARIGQEALWYYQSQDGNHQQAEIVPYSRLPREEVHFQIMDWQKHAGWNDRP